MTKIHKINPEKLLSTLHHDLVNIFFGAAMANDASAKYYEKLLTAYRKLPQADKEELHITENTLKLLEQNFANIRQEMKFGSFYLKSMRYNFCDYQDCTIAAVDISSLIADAKKQYEAVFQTELTFDSKTSVTENPVVNANYDILLNLVIRFLILDKHYNLSSVNLMDQGNNYMLEFSYKTERMLQEHLVDLDSLTLELPEISMAFNLSLCHNYVEFIGGKADYLYKNRQSYFMVFLPKGR